MKPIIHLQKFKSRESWENYIWRKLIEEFIKINSVKKINQLLNMLLTTHEKKQLINRIAAISLLRRKKSYREIGEMLWLSSTTISAIQKGLREQKYTSRYMRKKKQEKKQKQLSKEEIGQLLFNAKVSAFFTLPPPPIPHPRLNRHKRKYSYK